MAEEIVYGNFQCPVDECTCEFGNSHDLDVHVKSGSHGRLGDRFAEQNRRKFKYFTREMRVKEQIYREQSRSIDIKNKEAQEKLK